MKQLIKSATVYNAELPSAAQLLEHFAADVFAAPLALQAISVGFVPRDEDHGPLVESFPGGVAFTVRLDQKLLPSSAVKAELAKRVKLAEADTGRKVGKKKKSELKGLVTDELLAVALVRTTVVTCFHHTKTNFLIVPTTNRKVARSIVSLLVNSVGSVKTTTIHVSEVKEGLTTRLKAWLGGDSEAFSGLFPTSDVVLEQDDRKVSVRMTDLTSAVGGLNEALNRGFTVKSLGLVFQAGTKLRLTNSFQLRCIEIANPPEDDGDGDMFAAEASLEVEEVTDAITFLCEMFGYKDEQDA